jgi:hypothetical protein
MPATVTDRSPTLLFVVGPPAVGKMAVGHELSQRTGMVLFHNHRTIDLVLPFFAFGTPPFHRLVNEFRRRIFEEVALSALQGLIFTYVWAYDQASDEAAVNAWADIFRGRGGRVLYVELECTQAERLRRNGTEFRLAEKPSKRDVEQSRRQLLELDAKYQLDSKGRFDGRADYLRIDNTSLSAADVAERIIATFQLSGVGRT